MSIVKLKRLTLYGLAGEKGAVLEGLQELGCMHLVDLKPAAGRPSEIPTARPKATYDALRYLVDSPVKRRAVSKDADYDLDEVVELTLDNQRRRRAAHDLLDELRHAMREVEPWGDFEVPPPAGLGGQRLWFYVLPSHKMPAVTASEHVWQVVRRDHRHTYVVVIAESQPPADSMPVPPVALGDLSLSELRAREEHTVAAIEEVQAERWTLTRWIGLLNRDLARAENRAALELAGMQTHDAAEVFAVQGWVPVSQAGHVLEFADHRGLACTLIEPDPSDRPPVLLKNPPKLAAGEDLVSFFQLPGYDGWDPSLVVFFSFALFFAMILSDAGYAAVLGLFLALMWRRMGRGDTGRRLRVLAAWIVGASVAYGTLVGSYFGVSPATGSIPALVKVLDINDFDSMMKLSLVVGGCHVALANFMVAWNRRGSWSMLAPLGWLSIVAAGLSLLLGGSTDLAAARVPWIVMGAGGVGILFFSSEQPLERAVDFLWRLGDGLKAVAGLSGAFGDVLSYLRLFALGLSSASLAVTFNDLAVQSMDTPGIGLLFGLAILLLGHVLNLILAVISGVVHGLRLNLIEFFNWGVTGEGDTFEAFRKKETLSWIQ